MISIFIIMLNLLFLITSCYSFHIIIEKEIFDIRHINDIQLVEDEFEIVKKIVEENLLQPKKNYIIVKPSNISTYIIEKYRHKKNEISILHFNNKSVNIYKSVYYLSSKIKEICEYDRHDIKMKCVMYTTNNKYQKHISQKEPILHITYGKNKNIIRINFYWIFYQIYMKIKFHQNGIVAQLHSRTSNGYHTYKQIIIYNSNGTLLAHVNMIDDEIIMY